MLRLLAIWAGPLRISSLLSPSLLKPSVSRMICLRVLAFAGGAEPVERRLEARADVGAAERFERVEGLARLRVIAGERLIDVEFRLEGDQGDTVVGVVPLL